MTKSYLIPYDQMNFHPDSEQLVHIMMDKAQNTDPGFFRTLVAYYFSVAAAMMRTTIRTHDRGDIPVNAYAINLGTSGAGKGLSTGFMERSILKQFFDTFTQQTLPILSEKNLNALAVRRATRNGTQPDDELENLRRDYERQGAFIPIFDSATEAAVKQARHKLLLANAGSLNLQVDEIGSKLIGQGEVLTTFLELYDVGEVKQKLTKNTNDNIRSEEVPGSTAANMLLFGTPSRLLDGGKTEEEFVSILETGYARRCLFGYVREHKRQKQQSVDAVYNLHTSQQSSQFVQTLAKRIGGFADIINANKVLVMSQDVAKALIEYRLKCEELADAMPEHAEVRKAEMAHRYFKALKLSGAYAFVDGAAEITMENLYQAIRLVEESGKAFDKLMNRERPYAKLARYIAGVGHPVTQADLVEDLPFYKGTTSQKSDMLQLAIAYGYQNNIIIKKAFNDGIEFLRGEALTETNINEMIVAYSQDITYGYDNQVVPFDQLHKLTQAENYHWVNHHLVDGHRHDDKAIAGFNMIVLDIDGTATLQYVGALLKEYKFLAYTTKSHSATEHRFRIVMPISHTLKMDGNEFKEFMQNIYDWLPFQVDAVTGQRARKWASCHTGGHQYNDGKLLDILPFIPKTSKNEDRKRVLRDQAQLDALERWVINNTGDGNRNNQLLRYAMILVDAGEAYENIQARLLALNEKLADKLDPIEIMKTIMVSVGKKLAKASA